MNKFALMTLSLMFYSSIGEAVQFAYRSYNFKSFNVPSVSITIDDYISSGNTLLNATLGPEHLLIGSVNFCSLGIGMKNNRFYPFVVLDAEKWVTDSSGLTYKVSVLNATPIKMMNNKTGYAIDSLGPWENIPIPPGWVCNTEVPGGIYSGGIRNYNVPIKVEIDRAAAYPGYYTIRIPGATGGIGIFAQNTSVSTTEYESHVKSDMQKTPNNFTVDVNVLVNSKCEFTTKDILLNHGVIKVDSGITRSVTRKALSVNCNNAKIRMTARALEPVDGVSNVTRCGSGGKCEVLVNGQKQVELSVNSETSVDISSSYTAIRPDAGLFEGSAVVEILVL